MNLYNELYSYAMIPKYIYVRSMVRICITVVAILKVAAFFYKFCRAYNNDEYTIEVCCANTETVSANYIPT